MVARQNNEKGRREMKFRLSIHTSNRGRLIDAINLSPEGVRALVDQWPDHEFKVSEEGPPINVLPGSTNVAPPTHPKDGGPWDGIAVNREGFVELLAAARSFIVDQMGKPRSDAEKRLNVALRPFDDVVV